MKAILLIASLVFIGQRVPIQTTLWTNAQIPVNYLIVDTANQTDESIDLRWYLYNDTLVDYGMIQIGGNDLINYNANPDSFIAPYVCGRKGLVME